MRSEYQRAYYQEHRDEKLAKAAAYRRAHPSANRDYYREHRDEILARQAEFLAGLRVRKSEAGCVDCGRADCWLDYHHVDPSTKEFGVAGGHSKSSEAIEEEIAKCVVVCRKCHRRRHLELKFHGASERSAA